ncbi:MAG: PAS domain S-box protein [Isosphaeraceae bacterium]
MSDPALTGPFSDRTMGEGIAQAASEGTPSMPGPLAITTSVFSVAEPNKPYAPGAMGTILLAQDEKLGRTVVLKILHERHMKDRELRKRFRREAAITAQLQHPGVPPVYSAGSLSDCRPFFSMRLVEGRTLAQLLRDCEDRIRERPRFLTIFEHVCQTVAFAHARGIIHRDLKPSNIVAGEYGTVYVMDWGIARMLTDPEDHVSQRAARDSSHLETAETVSVTGLGNLGIEPQGVDLTFAGDLLGTPQYMSPEQAAGDPAVDERTDVFSLGAILFEILTGGPLRPVTTVHSGDLPQYSRAYLNTTQPALDSARADAPMVNLVRRCLELDLERRPRTASEVAGEVTAYLLHVLRRPEREMARFFELSLDLFCLAGLDGYFKQINPNFTRVLGHSTEELLARPFIDFVHPDDREPTQLQVERLSQGQPVVQFENRNRDQSGNYKWFEWTAKSVPEEGLIFAAGREITERKHLEQRLQAIVESSPVAMVITDKEGRIVQLNREAERLFGYDRSELVGRPIEVLIPHRFGPAHSAHRKRFQADPAIRHGAGRELWGLRKDGSEIPLAVGLSPLETEEGIFVISVIADVSETRRRERCFKALAESFPAGLIMIDHPGAICLVNRETERLFGYARDELIGRPVDLLFPDETCDGKAQSIDQLLMQSAAGVDGHADVIGKHRQGAAILMEARIHSLETGERVLFVNPILDFSPQSRA